MKKRWGCLLVIVGFAVCTGLASAITVINGDFEGDGLGPAEWADNTTPTGWTWNESESRGIGNEGSGNHFYWQGNAAWLSQTTDHAITAEGASYTLTVDVRDDWECIPRIALYYDDNGTWVELGNAVGSGADATWETVQLTVTTTAASVGKPLGVALSQADDTGWAHFDNVTLVSNAVILESPADGEEFVAKDADLEWSVASTVQQIDLYFGTENDPNLTLDPLGTGTLKLDGEPATTTSYSPTMNFNTTYYWKVVGYEPNTLLPGATDLIAVASDVASFATTGPSPVIQSMTPYAQSVPGDVGADPTITVAGVNFEFFEWSKDGQLLTDTVKYSGLDTGTLTINDMSLADEGIYSCVVSNTLSEDTDSANAVVVTERLISWWKLDGNLNDAVQDVVAGARKFDGIVDTNTLFTADDSGIDGGNSVILDVDDPNSPFLQIDGTEEFFNFYEDSMTINVWIRTSTVGWQGIFAKAPDQTSGPVIALDGEGEVLAQIDGDPSRLYANWPVADGQWHMVTLTYDGSEQKIYVDGELDTSTSGTALVSGISASENLAPVIMGAWNFGSPNADFTGNIANVKIYSYALTSTEIGEEYVATNPNADYVCNYELPSLAVYDVNQNCKIDLADFAAFADAWLDCNRIPQSACALQ